MNNNSDPLFDQYVDMDFSDAKPVAEIPALAKLQAEHGGKSRITMRGIMKHWQSLKPARK